LCGLSAGAAAAFFFDPISGRRRRSRLGDMATHWGRVLRRSASAAQRDLQNRARGIAAISRSLTAADTADDVVLEERVRTALGRAITRSHAVTVTACNGHVILDGPIFAHEEQSAISAVRAIPGVSGVETRFDTHIQPATPVPSAQAAQRVP